MKDIRETMIRHMPRQRKRPVAEVCSACGKEKIPPYEVVGTEVAYWICPSCEHWNKLEAQDEPRRTD